MSTLRVVIAYPVGNTHLILDDSHILATLSPLLLSICSNLCNLALVVYLLINVEFTKCW